MSAAAFSDTIPRRRLHQDQPRHWLAAAGSPCYIRRWCGALRRRRGRLTGEIGGMADDFQQLLARLVDGDEQALAEVVDAYYARLLPIARRKMQSLPLQVADEEGAVVSAFRSFFSAVRRQRFPNMNEPDNLWRVLATLTARKAIRQVRQHWKVSGERTQVDRETDVSRVVTGQPTPADVATLLDECEAFLEKLPDDALRQIALWRLEGYETSEIAERLDVHQRTVQRKLKLIESIWTEVARS